MPRSPDEEWSSERKSTLFGNKCTQLDNYVLEKSAQLRREPQRTTLQSIIDRVSAEADLYRILSTSAALESRTSFLAKLSELRASPPSIGSEIPDRARYLEEWLRQVDALLREYGRP